MKYILLLFLMNCTSFIYGQDKSYDYCYTNNKGICVYSVADKAEYVIVKQGQDPRISPDGKKVAYTTFSAVKADRTIAVIDLNTKKKVMLNTGSNNCYGAEWSPDQRYIAYHVFNEQTGKWDIAFVDANIVTSTPDILYGKAQESYGLSWQWQAASKNVVVQDMDQVYVLDLSGSIITSYKISDMISKTVAGADSGDVFVFTDDNKKIVFSIHMDNEVGDDGGPLPAIFVYDIDNRSTVRLSPKGYAAYGVVIKDNQVLFTASKLKSSVQNIYTVDMDGKNLKVLFKNCWDISAKN